MTRRLIATLVLSLGVVLAGYSFSTTRTVMAEQGTKKNSEGQKLFMQYCATCHGADAKGNGPTAKVLKKAPADLTKIEKVDGKFPKIRVQRIISGDDAMDSHGSRDMGRAVLRQKSRTVFRATGNLQPDQLSGIHSEVNG